MNKLLPTLAIAAMSVLAASIPGRTQEPNYRAEFPKGDASWSIKFTKTIDASDEKDKHVAKLKQVDVVRQGDLRCDTLIWTDGTKTEQWWSTAGNEVFFENRGDSSPRAVKASQKNAARYDETFFSWVGKSSYLGERELDGKKCWYFETSSRNADIDESQMASAWVDPKTARPFAWSDGKRTVFFEFKPLEPGFRMVIPPRFAEAVARYNAYRTPPARLKRR